MAKDGKNVLLIAQEIKLAKILAGNNQKLRERTLKRLGKWLIDRTDNAPVTDDVFMRIWKGLFYSMWMSDKPLVQEECAENIAKLIHFNDPNISLMFFKCFLQTMVNEWFGIDHHRIDKFLMLVRRVLRQTFEVLKNAKWADDHINNFREILNKTALKIDKETALGLVLHIDEIYLEELAKVSKGKLEKQKVLELIQPFAQHLARLDDVRHVKHVNQHIFRYLMEQSDIGIEYKEKFHAWRRQGFPGGTMNSLEKVTIENGDNEDNDDDDNGSIDDEDFENEPKDPRAGKVDVLLPQLLFDPNAIAKLLIELRFKTYTTSLGRKQIGILIQQFKKLAEGKYPLGRTKVATVPNDGYSTDLKSSVRRLDNLENKLLKHSNKAKKRQLRERKVKEILTEQIQQFVKQKNNTNVKEKKSPPETIEKLKTQNNTKPRNKVAEDSNDYEKFVAKSEANVIDQYRKTKTKKRKNPDCLVVPNSVVNKKKKKNTNSTVKGDLLKTKEMDLSKIPTKNPSTFVRSSGKWLVEEFDLPDSLPNSPNNVQSPKTKKSDKMDEWSKPLQNGETEFYVVSSNMKKKLKRLTNNRNGGTLKKQPSTTENLLHFNSPKTKSSKKSVIVKNPFSSVSRDTSKINSKHNSTPKSEKKIQFSNKNHSQDFSEYLKQIMSSPGIPCGYDSKKKPIKPLLKPSPISSPINPFYRNVSK